MKHAALTIPEIILIGGTRAALGAGIGLLLSDKLNRDTRRGAGWALVTVGALTTIPLAMTALRRFKGGRCGPGSRRCESKHGFGRHSREDLPHAEAS